MRLLPLFYATETMLCSFDGEDAGWLIGVVWLGITIELTIARRVRTVDGSDEVGV